VWVVYSARISYSSCLPVSSHILLPKITIDFVAILYSETPVKVFGRFLICPYRCNVKYTLLEAEILLTPYVI
jgi:hypothetical protein